MRVRALLVALAVTLLLPEAATAAVTSSTGPPLPSPGRTEVAGTRWRGRIAVGGGLVATAGGFEATPDLFLYDPGTRRWSRGPDLPGPRDHATLAVVGTSLYLVGGYAAHHGLGNETAEVWRLRSPRGRWQRVADLGSPRGALALAASDRFLVALGGVSGGRVLRTTEWYDPRADRWRPGPDMTTPREHFGAAFVAGRVYAVAGRNPGNLTSVESLAVDRSGPSGGWRAEPSLRRERGGNAAAAVAGRVCTAGGEEPAGTIAPVECLTTSSWETIGDLATPRHGLAVVGMGASLHVISGGPQPGATYSTAHEVFAVSAR